MSTPTARLRARLDSAADYARQQIPDAPTPCAQDLMRYIIELANHTPDEALPREVKAAEALWRAAMEVERLEGGA